MHGQKNSQWVHALGLKGLVRCTTSRRKLMGRGASKNMVAVQTIQLVQNEDEVDSLKFFKEHN